MTHGALRPTALSAPPLLARSTAEPGVALQSCLQGAQFENAILSSATFGKDAEGRWANLKGAHFVSAVHYLLLHVGVQGSSRLVHHYIRH